MKRSKKEYLYEIVILMSVCIPFFIILFLESGQSLEKKNKYLMEDKVAPVISDVCVFDVTKDGYWVKCKVVDEGVGVARVQFPTWTIKDAQDDLVENWNENSEIRGMSLENDVYSFYVSIKDHNNEDGQYMTHIYAWDIRGNMSFTGVEVDIE